MCLFIAVFYFLLARGAGLQRPQAYSIPIPEVIFHTGPTLLQLCKIAKTR